MVSPELALFRVKKNGSVVLSRHIDAVYKKKLGAKNNGSKGEEDGNFDEIFAKIPAEIEAPVYLLQFFGFMLAKVLCTDTVAGVDLDPIIFKFLQGKSLTWKDTVTCAPSFYKTCDYLNSKSMTSDDMVSFFVPIKIMKDEKKVVEIFKLKKEDEGVVDANKQEYFQSYFEKKYLEPTSKYLQAIKTGFLMAFPQEMMACLAHQELKLLICGNQIMTLDDIRKHASFGVDKNTEVASKQFWATMEKLNSEQLKKFLYFISGNSHIPYNFSGKFTFGFSASKNRAPTVSTCSYSGVFYTCDSQELFEKLFFCAIEGGHWGYDQLY
jgi:hypothetical protein